MFFLRFQLAGGVCSKPCKLFGFQLHFTSFLFVFSVHRQRTGLLQPLKSFIQINVIRIFLASAHFARHVFAGMYEKYILYKHTYSHPGSHTHGDTNSESNDSKCCFFCHCLQSYPSPAPINDSGGCCAPSPGPLGQNCGTPVFSPTGVNLYYAQVEHTQCYAE